MDNKLSYIPGAVIENQNSGIRLWNTANTLYLNGLSSNAFIRINDLSGRIIFIKQADTYFTTILQKGVYLVHISDQINKNKTMKCIIP